MPCPSEQATHKKLLHKFFYNAAETCPCYRSHCGDKKMQPQQESPENPIIGLRAPSETSNTTYRELLVLNLMGLTWEPTPL